MITKETCQRTNAANLKPDNVDINRHPVHVGYVFVYSFSCEFCEHNGSQNKIVQFRVGCIYLLIYNCTIMLDTRALYVYIYKFRETKFQTLLKF